ncbi:MAG: hypothetical protein V2I57_00865 [Xanthomonadales bacterium]|nr:hypothetical protein [Xanthomonadales bacterium]
MNHAVGTSTMRKREDRLSTWLIEASCFVVLLPISLVARLTGWRWKPWPPPGPNGYRSVLGETRAMSRVLAGLAISA